MVDAFRPDERVNACTDCGDIYKGDQHQCVSTVLKEVPNPFAMAPMAAPGHLGTREDIQEELDGIARAIRQFHIKQPDQVMRECSAYGARLTELAVLLYRVEGKDRQYTRIRTMQVARFIEEIDRQFKTASRLVEIQRQDLELSR